MRLLRALSACLFASALACGGRLAAAAESAPPAPEIERLFQLLDLDRPELAAVKRAVDAGQPDEAMGELLEHYRQRFPRESIKPRVFNNVARDADEALALRFRSRPSPKYFQLHRDFEWNRRPEEIADHHWLNLLVSLHQLVFISDMYIKTDDEKYAVGCLRVFDDWSEHCPPGSGSPSWSLATTMIRSAVLIKTFQRLVQWPDLPHDAAARLLGSIYDHAAMMQPRRGPGNQDATNSEHLMRLASAHPEFKDAPLWLTTGFERISPRIFEDVLADGCHFEMTSGYHLNAINTYTLAARRILETGQPLQPEYRDRLEKMYEWCLVMVRPDGSVPTNGDSVGSDVWGYLAEGGELFRRPDMTFVATQGKAGAAPQFLDAALPTGGYYTFRTSWTDPQGIYLFLDLSRRPVVSHQDYDALHLDLFAYGRDFFPDKGTFTYGGEHHKAAKATKNHTTITIDEKNQRDAPAKCHAFFSTPQLSFLDGSQAGYEGVTHRRQILFARPAEGVTPYFVVVDRVTGSGQHTVDQYFHFCPGELIREDAGAAAAAVRTNFDAGGNLRIVQLKPEGVATRLVETEMHPRQGQSVTRPGVRFRQQTQLPATFVTLLVPYSGPTPPQLTARLVPTTEDATPPGGGETITLRVDQAGFQDTLFAATEPLPSAKAQSPNARAGLIRRARPD